MGVRHGVVAVVTVPLERSSIEQYLDACIRVCRGKRNAARPRSGARRRAINYINAYQSVRATLVGAVLPEPPRSTK